MTLVLTTNFLLVLLIIEITKSLVVNNYFVNNLFFPAIKNSSNKKEIFNWLFNLFFLFTIISIIFISIIYFLIFLFIKNLPFLLLLFLIPLIIFHSFFIMYQKFLGSGKIKLIKSSTLTFYIIFFIIFFNYKNYDLIFFGFAAIIILEIIINYFILKNKLTLRIRGNYKKDFRNYYFVKKFTRFFFKSQITKIFLLITSITFIAIQIKSHYFAS
jgi:hypothetical protein